MITKKHCFPKTITKLALVFIFSLSVGLLTKSVLADEQKNEITMSPAKTTLDVKTGQSFDSSFKIYNTGSVDFKFKVYANPYSVKEGCSQDFETKSEQTQLSDWIKFTQTEYSVKAGDNVTVNYIVDVPTDIPDGGQYAVIFAETDGGTTGSILSTKRVGMLVYARTDGKTVLAGDLKTVTIDGLKFDNKLVVDLPIENTGNTDFMVEAVLEAKTLFGGTTKRIEQNGLAILPKSTCGVKLTWEDAPLFGLFHITTTTKFLDKTFEHSGWTLFVSPLAIGIVVLVVILVIVWARHGKAKKHY